LIVTCEMCTTQFQLDDSRVPAGGVRVRCSRCKHAFYIETPGPAAAAPEAEPAGADVAADTAATDFEDENDLTGESDWQFNDTPGGAPAAEASEASDRLDSASDAVDALLGGDSDEAESAGAREPASPEPDAADDEELLGSPESWDFLASEAPAAPAAPASPPAAELPRARVHPAPPAADEWIDPAEPSRVHAWLARGGHAVGWSATALLLALVGVVTLAPGLPPGGAALPAQLPVGPLEARELTARWVENAAAGPLFVVSGRLANPGGAPLSLGEAMGVRLLDTGGTRLSSEPAAIGPVIPELELREGDPETLRARQLAGSFALAATPLRPGEALAFEAVLTSLPPAASRFVLEALPRGRAAADAAAPAR
jgi:predicted Zn finger-like uncharacterized protein